MPSKVNAAKFMPDFTINVVKGTESCVSKFGDVDGLDDAVPAFVSYVDGDDSCTICLTDMFFRDDMAEKRQGALVHESVHCAQAWLKSIGEDQVGDEGQAYMVQACYEAIISKL